MPARLAGGIYFANVFFLFITTLRYSSAVYAVVVCVCVCVYLAVCHTPVLYQNG